MEVRSDLQILENLKELERSFSRRHRRSIGSSYSKRSDLSIIPTGSDIFEQVLKEMKNESNKQKEIKQNKPTNKTKVQENAIIFETCKELNEPSSENSVDIEPVVSNVSETPATLRRPPEMYSTPAKSSPEMYLSCRKYPWICVETRCVHQTSRLHKMKLYSIKAVAKANEQICVLSEDMHNKSN